MDNREKEIRKEKKKKTGGGTLVSETEERLESKQESPITLLPLFFLNKIEALTFLFQISGRHCHLPRAIVKLENC